MKRFLALMLLSCICLLTACEELTEGVVVEKNYHKEETYVSFIPMVISTGKTTITNIIPMVIHHPESWEIIIEGEFEGKVTQENYFVTNGFFDGIKVGDYFKYNNENKEYIYRSRPEDQRDATDEDIEKYEER